MTLRYVHPSEVKDFHTALRQRGLGLDQFDLSDTPWRLDPPGALAGPTIGTVTITSRKSGATRTYKTGGVSISTSPLIPWVTEFLQDVDQGVFD